jgi:hypothetical protein
MLDLMSDLVRVRVLLVGVAAELCCSLIYCSLSSLPLLVRVACVCPHVDGLSRDGARGGRVDDGAPRHSA